MASSEHTKRRVCYYYDTCVGNYYYGQGHVMKPHRIKMAHSLVLNYGLYRHMEIFRPFPATYNDLVRFHTEDYVNFLRDCTPQNLKLFNRQTIKFNADEDCPIFDGLYEFCQISSGGSLAAAVKLNKRKTDIAINWMGGLHHAKKSESSGFCYTNDIVLGILELLKHHERVLYIDIDVHHGDGVEEAFYTTDRVMTCSFHRYGDFFPGTGNITDVGMGQGERYAVNVPLSDGITDDAYKSIFEPVIARIMETYRPSAVVLQCGADSLNGDRLGNFNMTLRGHGNCVRYLRSFNVPLMLVGGGGYTARNVARCWTYETALAVNQEISNTLPHNDYFEFYQPSFKLHIDPQIGLRDENAKDTLEKLQQAVFENLRQLPHVPSVQMQPLKPDAVNVEEVENICLESSNPDERLTEVETDKMIEDPGELYDGEKEGGGRNEQSSKPAKRIRLAAASFPTVLTVSSEDEMEVDATDDNNSPVEPHAIMKEDENANSTQEKLPKTIVETLSVQMQALTPVNAVNVKMAEESSIPNERPTQAKSAKVIVDLGELYDGEKEGGGRNEQQSSKPAKRTAASFPPLFTISDSEDAMEVDGNNSPVEPQAVMKDQNAKDTHDKSPKTVVETLSIQMQALQPMNAVSVKKAEESSNPNKRLTKKAGGGGRNEQPSKRPKRSGKTLRAVLREIARRVENGLTSSDSSEDEMDVDVTGDNGSHGGVRK